MATYVIGDVHGCFTTLEALWERLEFDLETDRLWMVGDLVNRGPDSVAVLRWARELEQRLGSRFAAVLGNHDLHLLAFAAGARRERPRDRLRQVTDAADAAELLSWLRHRPLLYRHRKRVLVHAGIHPLWSLRRAAQRARTVEAELRSSEWRQLVSPSTGGDSMARDTLRVLTSLRCCRKNGDLCAFSGPLTDVPPGCQPWFEARRKRSRRKTIVFGHWAALGVHFAANAIALDSGCVWGGQLTAIRLEDRQLFQQPTLDAKRPS